jgi:hypothetical protein
LEGKDHKEIKVGNLLKLEEQVFGNEVPPGVLASSNPIAPVFPSLMCFMHKVVVQRLLPMV